MRRPSGSRIGCWWRRMASSASWATAAGGAAQGRVRRMRSKAENRAWRDSEGLARRRRVTAPRPSRAGACPFRPDAAECAGCAGPRRRSRWRDARAPRCQRVLDARAMPTGGPGPAGERGDVEQKTRPHARRVTAAARLPCRRRSRGSWRARRRPGRPDGTRPRRPRRGSRRRRATSGAQFAAVMPPMATQGSSISSDHQRRILGVGAGRRLFGRGREEGAEGDVVGAVLAGLHGEVAAGVAGDAQGEAGQELAGVGGRRVGLADMGAVAARSGGEVGAVVEQEGDAAGLDDRAQGVDGAAPGVVGRVLQAELDCRPRRRRRGRRRACPRTGGRR